MINKKPKTKSLTREETSSTPVNMQCDAFNLNLLYIAISKSKQIDH
jgi:hypothetical protein